MSSSVPGRSSIVLMGDSITQTAFAAKDCGWANHLSDLYQRRADVYNRGMSGYNTDWYLRYLQSDIGQADVLTISNVKLVILFFGANDASDPKLNLRQHVPLEQYRQNLYALVHLCREQYGSDVNILFIGPPPIHHKSRLQYQIHRYGKERATGRLERTLELSGSYAKACSDVALDLNLPFLNLWSEMQNTDIQTSFVKQQQQQQEDFEIFDNEQPWHIFLSDGLHLSRLGQLFVGKRIMELIQLHFPLHYVTPDPITGFSGNSASKCMDIVSMGPWHDQIDHENPEKSFS